MEGVKSSIRLAITLSVIAIIISVYSFFRMPSNSDEFEPNTDISCEYTRRINWGTCEWTTETELMIRAGYEQG